MLLLEGSALLLSLDPSGLLLPAALNRLLLNPAACCKFPAEAADLLAAAASSCCCCLLPAALLAALLLKVFYPVYLLALLSLSCYPTAPPKRTLRHTKTPCY